MRLFYDKYKNCQPLAGNLSWSHYCYLIYIEDDDERRFYENECINSKWSKRELKRQIDSSLFQRLLLSEGNANKQKVLELAKEGQTINNPKDILKEPYVFEFLGIKENKPLLEAELEKNLINHLSSFLLELGKGFMYVGNQIRITLDSNTHYYIDLVFYNKILKSYVLIDLKMDDMKPEYVGQMNMYINYYNKEIKEDFDNKTIGIILCTSKKGITMEYALGGLSNNIFASTYTYYIPNKDELINEVEKVLNNTKETIF
jgi:predicted nuclease of restriction endonuclease-like (RecB) superfamily